MLVELLMVLGLVTTFQPGDPCIDALHELRVMERMRIQSTEMLEDNVIAYTLTDGPRISNKTAILVCRRDVEDDGALDEDGTDEALDEVLENETALDDDGLGEPSDDLDPDDDEGAAQ